MRFFSRYQLISCTDLLQIRRFDEKQIAERVKGVEKRYNDTDTELLNAFPILVHVADSAHRASRIELKLLEMLVNNAMKPYAELR